MIDIPFYINCLFKRFRCESLDVRIFHELFLEFTKTLEMIELLMKFKGLHILPQFHQKNLVFVSRIQEVIIADISFFFSAELRDSGSFQRIDVFLCIVL